MKVIGLLACVLVITCGCNRLGKDNKLPNVVYVLADDLGYGDIAIYNPECKIKTPNIDQLGQEGIRFTDAHTSSSVCTPTRYGIITGRYNWRSKLKSSVLWGKSKALIPNERTTVADVFNHANYNTAFFGKWHLGWDWVMNEAGEIDFTKELSCTPNDLGFDYFYAHAASLDMSPYVYVENGKATAIPTETTVNKDKFGFWREGLTAPDFVHEEVTPNFFERTFDYIGKKAKEDKPFFIYLALPSPHTPILPNEKWQGKSGLSSYGDFVMMIDDYMGQLDKVLQSAGVDDNTIVVFTSDNGCSPAADINAMRKKGHDANYIYRGHKADIYEGGHRVPFLVKWPKEIKGNLVCDEIICTTDFMATAADIVEYDLKDSEGEDSYSFLRLLTDNTNKESTRGSIVHHSIDGDFAIRKNEWKLILCGGSGGWSFPRASHKAALDTLPKYQLYNLKDDPKETNNLIYANKEKAIELKTLLSKIITEGRSTPGAAQQNDEIDGDWKQVSFIKDFEIAK